MRINLIGGPGVRKDTLASYIYFTLKEKNYSIELIQEWVKPWAYKKIPIKDFDQLKILTHQIEKEQEFLPYVRDIVTCSPVLLSAIYGEYYEGKNWQQLYDVVQDYDEHYPGFYIYLKRDENIVYQEDGRYQSSKEANEVDQFVKDRLINYLSAKQHNSPALTILNTDKERLLELVLANINGYTIALKNTEILYNSWTAYDKIVTSSYESFLAKQFEAIQKEVLKRHNNPE